MIVSRKLKVWIQDGGKEYITRFRVFLKCEAVPGAVRILAGFVDKEDAVCYRDAVGRFNDAEVVKKIEVLKNMGYKT